MTGRLRVDDGRYENLLTGTRIQGLELRTEFSEQGQLAMHLRGHDAAEGTLTVEAKTSLSAPLTQLRAKANLSNLLLVSIDAASAWASGDITIQGGQRTLAVKGKVTVDEAELRLLNPIPASIVDLGPIEVAGAPQRPASDAAKSPPSLMTLDLDVDAPGRLFVRGRGLDSQWGGQLRVRGDLASPELEGSIAKHRGHLDFVGRSFTLSKGSLSFAGTAEIDPLLDIELEREANGITGKIIVDGRASAPRLRFISIPGLPPEEVLPQVLFGRSKQSLSAPEAVQLAAGVATLMSGKAGLLDQTRQSLGVDVLRFESEGSGAQQSSSISVGHYATEKVYLGAKQSLDGKSTSVVVKFEVHENLVLDADVSQDANSSVGVTWRRDF